MDAKEFLSLAAHDLRSPLAAVKGRLALIADGTYGTVDARAKQELLKAQHAVDELLELIDLLLDLRQVEAGKLEYHFARTDLRKAAREAAESLAPLALGRGLELSIETPEREVWVNADEKRLRQVIRNLVDNGIKYTPRGSVRVAVAEESDAAASAPRGGPPMATVTIADTGLGIGAAALPHIFEEFARDDRVKKEFRGSGLGLFIAATFVAAHGGTIAAESAGEGRGSAFTVRLPLVR